MQALLYELPLESGSISINGSISYVSQEPWIFAATARQNILFGQNMDQNRYDAVVHCTDLLKDFEQFSEGDMTMIGESGSLSGGQKARIKYVSFVATANFTHFIFDFFFCNLSLARAVYRTADIYLLDDPLSAVNQMN